ncbi:helix-turn-helix transcriptional regulator [Micrococcus terreus]|uniref:helix-turn-helix transcriptional regulator n=1 Tax=Micrococcus terreus TaxID=574650 RepID=UPI0023F6817C|nr:helix-turn-helix transcriptional regulator [Micrococcus terreus]
MHTPPEPDMTRLAHAFKVHKANSGMTYDQLADATGLARQTLLNLASGRTYGDLRTWLILAKVWGVPVDEATVDVWVKQ